MWEENSETLSFTCVALFTVINVILFAVIEHVAREQRDFLLLPQLTISLSSLRRQRSIHPFATTHHEREEQEFSSMSFPYALSES